MQSAFILFLCTAAALLQPERPAEAPIDRRAAINAIVESYQPDPNAQNRWTEAIAVVFEGAAIARAFEEESEPLRELPPERQRLDWLLGAYAARDEACTPELEAEAKRCLDRFRATKYFERLQQTPHGKLIAPLWQKPIVLQEIIGVREVRLLGYVCLARIREASDAASPGRTPRAVGDMLFLSRVMTASPEVTAHVHATALRAWAARRIIAEAVRGRLPAGDAEHASSLFQMTMPTPVKDIVEMQRHATLEHLDWICEQVKLDTREAKNLKLLEIDQSAPEHRAYAAGVCNKWIDAGVDLTSDDASTRRKGREAIFEIQKKSIKEQRSKRGRLTDNVLPGVEAVVERHRLQRCVESGLGVMAAIERYHAEQGTWPANLDALVPKHMKKIPVDLFSDGAPLGYKLVDPATDPLKRAYLLYSVGTDGVDDGGAPAPKGPDGRERFHGKGFDYIINALD